MSVDGLVDALLRGEHARARLRVDPVAFLAEHGVGSADLGELADRVEAATRALPAAERRSVQALVFVALTTAGR